MREKKEGSHLKREYRQDRSSLPPRLLSLTLLSSISNLGEREGAYTVGVRGQVLKVKGDAESEDKGK